MKFLKIITMSSVVDGDDISDSDPDPSPEDKAWTRITDRSECRSAMNELKDQMNYLLDNVDAYVTWARNRLIQDKFENYSKFLDKMFPNDTFNATSVPSHVKCLGLKNEVIEMDDLFLLITELGWNISRALSYDESYGYAVQIPPLHKRRRLYDESFIAGSFKSQLIDYFRGYIVSWEAFGRLMLIRTK